MTGAKVRGCGENVKRKVQKNSRKPRKLYRTFASHHIITPVENSDRRKSLEKILKASQNSPTFFIAEQLFRQPPVF